MNKTVADFAHEYAPYNKLRAFWHSVEDYQNGSVQEFNGVYGQTYDRSMECAMRVQQINRWVQNNVGLN